MTGNHNLDLTRVSIDNDDTTLTISVTVDNLDADWGKYMLFIETGAPGNTGNSNPWFRNVDHGGNSISQLTLSCAGGQGIQHFRRFFVRPEPPAARMVLR